MFWNLRIRPGEDERKVYAEAAECGIVCKPQDLEGIVERLDKYIKKTKFWSAVANFQYSCSKSLWSFISFGGSMDCRSIFPLRLRGKEFSWIRPVGTI